MALFAWFGNRKAAKPSPFYTMVFEHKFDLLPAAREVHTLAGNLNIDAETLAQYAMTYGDGKHIRKGDLPEGMTAEAMNFLIARTVSWARWPYRRDQLQDPDIAMLHSHARLVICDFCRAATGGKHRDFAFKDIVRLPLSSVPLNRGCYCTYRAVRNLRRSR